MIYLFSIDGNIGAGKSTLIKKLEAELTVVNRFPVKFLLEPVDLWTSIRNNVFGKNILELFYEDQIKYSFQFQVLVLSSLVKQINDVKRLNEDCILITERSIFTSMFVFAEMLHDDNKSSKIEYDILKMLFEQISSDIELCGIIYLDTSIEICHERILKRARSGEDIDMTYLVKLERYYKRFINSHKTLILTDDYNIKKIESFIFDLSSYSYLSKQ